MSQYSESFYFDLNCTDTTSSSNKVYLDTHHGRRAVFLEKYHFKRVVNPSQYNHIIEELVVNKGFMMDKNHNQVIEFSHPHNTPANSTYYYFHTYDSSIEKVTRSFLNFV